MVITVEISSLSPPLSLHEGGAMKVVVGPVSQCEGGDSNKSWKRKCVKIKIWFKVKGRLMRTVISASLKQRGVLMGKIQVWRSRLKENLERKRTANNRLLCESERAKRKDERGWFKRHVKRWAAKWRRESDRQWSHSHQAVTLLKGQPLCLLHQDWGGREWIMRLDYSPWDGTLFRINPPGNYRQHNSSPQPGQSGKRLCQRTTSSSSMTCCLLVSEPLALSLLLLHIQPPT